MRKIPIIPIMMLLALVSSRDARAANYHLVGWVNAFVPGGGQLLLGDYTLAGAQAVIEVGTFGGGYIMSARQPMTIDGVPEDLPTEGGYNQTTSKSSTRCTRWGLVGGHVRCLQTATTTTSSTTLVLDSNPQDFKKPLYADLLQELGLKYHMVNVYNAYRTAANGTNPMIDKRSTGEMFMDPFKLRNLLNPWVFVAMGIVAGATVYDYYSQIRNGLIPIEPMNKVSNDIYAFNYEIWQPFGSGAPEEMFYRGFLQNEFYSMVPSPFFSIPLSTAAFSFSHAPSGRIGAAIAGSYLGLLAHIHKGDLGPGITLHFWSVVMLGIETVLLSRKAQGATPPPGFQVQMSF